MDHANFVNEQHNTPIHIHAQVYEIGNLDDFEFLQYLIEKKAAPNILNKQGIAAMDMLAVKEAKLLDLLIKKDFE